MSEVHVQNETAARIKQVHAAWAAAANAARLSPEEAVNCAAEWLACIIISAMNSEKAAHEVLNTTTENSHEFINDNWREAQKRREAANR